MKVPEKLDIRPDDLATFAQLHQACNELLVHHTPCCPEAESLRDVARAALVSSAKALARTIKPIFPEDFEKDKDFCNQLAAGVIYGVAGMIKEIATRTETLQDSGYYKDREFRPHKPEKGKDKDRESTTKSEAANALSKIQQALKAAKQKADEQTKKEGDDTPGPTGDPSLN